MSSENQFLMFLILVFALVAALTINYVIYRRQVNAQQRRLRAKKIQALLPDLLECLSILKQTDCNPEIPVLLENYAAEQLEELTQLSPSPELIQKLENSRSEPSSAQSTQIANFKQIQQAANKSTTVLTTLKSLGKISPKQLDDFTLNLKLTKMFSEARSLVDVAAQLHEQNKESVAKNHLRQAKGIISKIPDTEPRKLALREQITDLLNASIKATQEDETSDAATQSSPPEST